MVIVLVVRSPPWSFTSLLGGFIVPSSNFKFVTSPPFGRVGLIISTTSTWRSLISPYILGLIVAAKVKQLFGCSVDHRKVLHALFVEFGFRPRLQLLD